MRAPWIVALIALAACASSPSSTTCATGIVCPAGLKCAAVQPICIENDCGDGHPDSGEECDDGNVLDGDGCSHDCHAEMCGNGRIDPGEQCDDGNHNAGDKCSPMCTIEVCGNGIMDPGEACDDGNTSDVDATGHADGCSANCKSNQTCGNCVVDTVAGEICDDCNTTSGDQCESDCKSGVGCGNGFTDPGEQCDDGNTVNDDDCKNDCTINVCGDHVVNLNGAVTNREQCDPGTGGVPLETSGCNIDCTFPACGDGKVNHQAGEQCDRPDGITNADGADCTSTCQFNVCGDGLADTAGPNHFEACDTGGNSATCNADCTVPACGDGKVDPSFTPTGGPGPEQCDDGNTTDGDGCSALCRFEHCGNGVIDAGEQCDGAPVGGFACAADCHLEKCGNGILDPGEECDDGNPSDTDDCLSSNPAPTACKRATCGDGHRDALHEQCDSGGAESATCDGATCRTPVCGDNHRNLAAGEACDHGSSNGTPGDTCDAYCKVVGCGNGVVDLNEQCDPNTGSPASDSATCDFDCTIATCGDGHTNSLAGETCDDGSANGNPCAYNNPTCTRCNATCTATVSPGGPFCGDSVVNGPEACDLGNANGASTCDYGIATCPGCNASCTQVTSLTGDVCGNGNVDPVHESCDDHNTNACGTCSADCRTPITAAHATGLLVTPGGASLSDGDTFQLDDGFNTPPIVFEFTNGTAAAGHIKITHPNNTASAEATLIVNAITGQSPSLDIDASSLSGGIISLTNTHASSKGNKAIVLSTSLTNNPDWGTADMSGGAAGDCAATVGCRSNLDCASGNCNLGQHKCQ